MSNARFEIHLDGRWDECFVPEPGYTAWPNEGLIASILWGRDISPGASGVAMMLAYHAARGRRVVPADSIATGSADRPATIRAALRTLADLGFITITDGCAE